MFKNELNKEVPIKYKCVAFTYNLQLYLSPTSKKKVFKLDFAQPYRIFCHVCPTAFFEIWKHKVNANLIYLIIVRACFKPAF